MERKSCSLESLVDMVLRAKTSDLLKTKELTQAQSANSELNKIEMAQKSIELNSYPQRLVLELTNACNLNCIMCGRDEVEFKLTTFDINILKKLEPILNKVEEVTLFGWGEPTLHPQFIEILKYLNDFPVRKYFVTNGMRLDKIKDALFDCKADIMAVSLDGAVAKTNNRIRVNSDFDFIVNQLKDIVRIKKEKDLTYPYINSVMTLMDSNISELPSMVQLASDIGLEEVKGVFLTVFSDNLISESLYNKQDKVKKYFDEAIELGEKLNIKIKLPYMQGEDVSKDNNHKDCYNAWRDFFVGSDGFIRPCQSSSLKLLEFNFNQSFEQMWNSNEFKDFRQNINTNNESSSCKKCYQSSFANWNKKESFVQIGQNFAPEWEKSYERKDFAQSGQNSGKTLL